MPETRIVEDFAVVVNNEPSGFGARGGIHARPSRAITEEIKPLIGTLVDDIEISVFCYPEKQAHLEKTAVACGTDLMDILMLIAIRGTILRLEFTGDAPNEAADILLDFFANGFGNEIHPDFLEFRATEDLRPCDKMRAYVAHLCRHNPDFPRQENPA